MVVGIPWMVVGMLASGLGSLALLAYLWPYRDRPGAPSWFAVITLMALWSLSYGAALLVFDPGLRRLFEIPIWIAINWIGVFFLTFSLSYTGRSELVRSPVMGGVVLFELVSTGVGLTNGFHHLVWSDYGLDPVYGLATVSFTPEPWIFVQWGVLYLCTAIGIIYLVETVAGYGPLYRTQAAAIALSPVLPAAASLLWLFDLGPAPQLNLTPLMFLPHLALDVYALFGGDMFEMSPATRRAGERAAIDDLGSPVLVVENGKIIDCNHEAERVCGRDREHLLGSTVEDAVGTDVALDGGHGATTLRVDGQRREFNVVTSPFWTDGGTHGGYTVVLQDVTSERQRKQRLEVLNRILRHNLRNDLNVVGMYASELESRAGDPERAEMAARIADKSSALVDLGEKARSATEALDGTATEPVAVGDLLAGVAADLRAAYPGATVTVDAPADLSVETDPAVLALVVENAMENGLEHDTGTPRVTVSVATYADGIVVEVADDGPGIPEHEVEVVRTGREDALRHGSGIGLWLVQWGTTALGGDVEFESDDDGTSVRIRVPDLAGRE